MVKNINILLLGKATQRIRDIQFRAGKNYAGADICKYDMQIHNADIEEIAKAAKRFAPLVVDNRLHDKWLFINFNNGVVLTANLGQ